MKARTTLIRLAATIGLVAAPLFAGATDAITDAMQEAYASYRIALFKTNGKSVPEAQQALLASHLAWQNFTQGPGANIAGSLWARDTAYHDTLSEVDARYRRAIQEVKGGQLEQAHETLEGVRDLLAKLRQRNGVVVYSDARNAYHHSMETLLTDGPKLLDQPQGFMHLMARIGVLEYQAQQLRAQALPTMFQNPSFEPLLRDVQASVCEAICRIRVSTP